MNPSPSVFNHTSLLSEEYDEALKEVGSGLEQWTSCVPNKNTQSTWAPKEKVGGIMTVSVDGRDGEGNKFERIRQIKIQSSASSATCKKSIVRVESRRNARKPVSAPVVLVTEARITRSVTAKQKVLQTVRPTTPVSLIVVSSSITQSGAFEHSAHVPIGSPSTSSCFESLCSSSPISSPSSKRKRSDFSPNFCSPMLGNGWWGTTGPTSVSMEHDDMTSGYPLVFCLAKISEERQNLENREEQQRQQIQQRQMKKSREDVLQYAPFQFLIEAVDIRLGNKSEAGISD